MFLKASYCFLPYRCHHILWKIVGVIVPVISDVYCCESEKAGCCPLEVELGVSCNMADDPSLYKILWKHGCGPKTHPPGGSEPFTGSPLPCSRPVSDLTRMGQRERFDYGCKTFNVNLLKLPLLKTKHKARHISEHAMGKCRKYIYLWKQHITFILLRKIACKNVCVKQNCIQRCVSWEKFAVKYWLILMKTLF